MSGSDPTGFSWFSDIVSGDSAGWEATAAFGGFGGLVIAGAYLSGAAQTGAFAEGGSLNGFTGASGLGGAYAVGEAFAGLNDPGANATYAAPTGELGSGVSQGGLYNEGAGAAPPRAGGAMACGPGCQPNPRSAFPDTPLGEAQYQAWLEANWVVGNVILAAEGLVSVGGSMGRWLLGRGAARVVIEEGKLGYLLGQAGGRAHNVERALQNAAQLGRVGVHDTPVGRELLRSHLQAVATDASNVTRTFSNKYGDFVVKESLFSGPGGFLKFESTWQAQGGGLRLTTVIPFGG